METKQALFHEYEEAKRGIKELEEKLDELKPLIKNHIPDDTEISTGTAIFTMSKGKPRWKYSQTIGEAELELKDKMQEERQTGAAEQVYGAPFVVCNLK
jgi:hypothetical protein